MQAKTDAKAAETASLLESFGIELSVGGLVVMTDFAKAERAYIHHTSCRSRWLRWSWLRRPSPVVDFRRCALSTW